VVTGCDVLTYSMLMARLGMLEASAPIVAACVLRALFIPAARILAAVVWSSSAARRVAAAATSSAFYGGVLVHLVYAGFFHTVPLPKAMHHLGELPETTTQLVLQLFGPAELVLAGLFLTQAAAMARVLRRWRPPRGRALLGLAALVALFIAQIGAAHRVNDRFSDSPSDRHAVYGLPDAVLRFGLADLWWSQVEAEWGKRRHPIPDTPYPGKIADEPGRPETGAGRRRSTGENLIMIQMESVDPWVVEAEVDGRPVMPFLRSLERRARVFDRIYAQHSGGGSSDAELAALLSLLPLSTHSGLLTADWDRVRPLPRHLEANGYSTIALHANRATYFNRDLAYPKLGFQSFHSESSFDGAARGWRSRDAAFFAQSAGILESTPQPFMALLITMQCHGPFTNHDADPTADPGPAQPRLLRDYLQCMSSFDAALAGFDHRLDAFGLTERSIMVFFGDHDSQVRKRPLTQKEKIPLFIAATGLEPGRSDRVGSHLDLGPTVLDLLGIDEPGGWLGTSLLAPGPGRTLFNDLTEIGVVDGDVRSRRAPESIPFMLYSARLLDP
jgi:phosphoglycerol transferase MdoB-like AlkP superfamily enzyme